MLSGQDIDGENCVKKKDNKDRQEKGQKQRESFHFGMFVLYSQRS